MIYGYPHFRKPPYGEYEVFETIKVTKMMQIKVQECKPHPLSRFISPEHFSWKFQALSILVRRG